MATVKKILTFILLVWGIGGTLTILILSFYTNAVLKAYQPQVEGLGQRYMVHSTPIYTVEKPEIYTVELPEIEYGDKEQIKNLIVDYAQMSSVSSQTALRIAQCESGYQYAVKNPNSSATGVYQWTIGTWEAIGSPGDRLNPHDNIRAFMEWYPSNPSWWVCK